LTFAFSGSTLEKTGHWRRGVPTLKGAEMFFDNILSHEAIEKAEKNHIEHFIEEILCIPFLDKINSDYTSGLITSQRILDELSNYIGYLRTNIIVQRYLDGIKNAPVVVSTGRDLHFSPEAYSNVKKEIDRQIDLVLKHMERIQDYMNWESEQPAAKPHAQGNTDEGHNKPAILKNIFLNTMKETNESAWEKFNMAINKIMAYNEQKKKFNFMNNNKIDTAYFFKFI
jgi:hypothetical protein